MVKNKKGGSVTKDGSQECSPKRGYNKKLRKAVEEGEMRMLM